MNRVTNFAKKAWPDLCVVLVFLAISFAYFITPLSQGLVLSGHDNTGATGISREANEYLERTGERSRWTNALFGGMPTYQIAPSYGSTQLLGHAMDVFRLGITSVMGYLVLYLLGFYILMRAFNFKPYLAALGSILWAFSSYFLIIIAAGHMWKVLVLGFVPPTIAGMVLCYRGKYLWGGLVTALFTALQILSNHVQMTYYFLFVMAFIVLAYGVVSFWPKADKEQTDMLGVELSPRNWLKATATIIVAGLIGASANLTNLYHTYEYQKHSMRGPSELSATAEGDNKTAGKSKADGLERDYITQWSYGIGETFTLLIPDFKGGGNGSIMERESLQELEAYNDFYAGASQASQIMQQSGVQAAPPGMDQYWGEQPFTVGPVYVGALVCFLFVMGIFYVRGPMKWALLAATVVSLLFAWGKNLMPVTDFFIDYLPMYNKFRTVSSALVIAEFTMPLLGILALARFVAEPDMCRRKPLGFCVALVVTAGTCLLLAIAPGIAGDCISSRDTDMLAQLGSVMPVDSYRAAISALHHHIIATDALRSLIIIAIGVAIMWIYSLKKIPAWALCSALGLICLFDLWNIDKRYLNDDNFTDPVMVDAQFETKTPADEAILQDKGEYRVLDISKNIFNDNTTGYWHKNIGGYHAAKLHRYQDLIDRHISKEIPQLIGGFNQAIANPEGFNTDTLSPVLNMLNLKYIIHGSGEQARALENPGANGNGWFVNKLDFVPNADAEMAALTGLDTKHAAVADETFREALDGTALDTGSVKETFYEPNEIHYDVESQRGGVVVLSEVYYPSWTATIDGEEVAVGRVNYILRAVKVPAGKHELKLEFRPASIRHTESVAYGAMALMCLLLIYAIYRETRKKG